jgi:4-carboxymuconolactone decarboxylase
MTPALRSLVALSAAIAWRDPAVLAAAIERAVRLAGPLDAEEALLQSYLFVGYPAALNAIAAWRRRTGRAAPARLAEPASIREERGERICRAVYGGAYVRLRANVAALQPELDAWMIEEGYGKVLGRPGMELVARELCIVGLLGAQPAADQLFSHMRGALRVGASMEDLEQALAEVAGVVSPERASAAYAVWQRVQARTGEG